MTELGSVFEQEDPGAPRGPDLHVSVEVPRAALGHTLRARIPRRLASEGELVDRASPEEGGDEDPEVVRIHLPEGLPDRAMLKLRGQGGVAELVEGRPGDLHVLCELVDRPPRAEEVLSEAAALRSSGTDLAQRGPDLTWWLLIGLALVGAAVLAVLAL